MVVSGGGSGALHALLSHEGASRFFLQGHIPYSSQALFQYLTEEVSSACSAETAQKMAEQAFKEAAKLSGEKRALGISCTAALKTNPPRRGEDRAFLCFCSWHSTSLHRIALEETSRQKQEEKLSLFLLEKLAFFLEAEIKNENG